MTAGRTDRLRALVVGTGFGCRIQVPALRGAGYDVVGLVGSDPARTAERAAANGLDRHFVDLDRAIAETAPDVVAISTPPHSHAALAIRALEKNDHCICLESSILEVMDAIFSMPIVTEALVSMHKPHVYNGQGTPAISLRLKRAQWAAMRR